MQGQARVDGVQVDVQDPLDLGQPLVEGRSRQVGGVGGGGLVAAVVEVGPQQPDQGGVGGGVVGQERAQLALDEGLQAGVVAEQVQQAAEPDVRQSVEGSRRLVRGRVATCAASRKERRESARLRTTVPTATTGAPGPVGSCPAGRNGPARRRRPQGRQRRPPARPR